MRIFQSVTCALVIAFLSSCGGGGSANPNSLTLNPSSVSLVADPPNPSATVVATYHGAGVVVGTLPGQSLVSWLSVSAGPVTSNQVSIQINTNTYGLQPGRYNTTLRVATGDADKSNVVYKDLPVLLTVPLTISPSTMDLTYVAGADAATLNSSLSIKADSISWTAQANVSWIHLSTNAGTGSTTLALSIDPTGLNLGDYKGTVTVTDSVTNHAVQTPITLKVVPRTLLVQEQGLGFISIGKKQRLSRVLSVTDNAHLPTKWSASADKPWINLGSTNGTTDDAISITANPAALTDGFHSGTITLTPTGVSPAIPTTVRVGLYIEAAGTAPDSVSAAIEPNGPLTFDLVSDPIRPFFYVALGSYVQILNGQTGESGGIISFPSSSISRLVITPDGRTLYCIDQATGTILPYDLDTQTQGSPITGARPSEAYTWSKIEGKPVILTSQCQAIDTASGQILADALAATDILYPSRVAVSPDGKSFCIKGGSNGNHDLVRFSLSYRNGTLTMRQTFQMIEPGGDGTIAFTRDGNLLYSASPGYITMPGGPSYGGAIYNPSTMARIGYLPPQQVVYDKTVFAPGPSGIMYVSRQVFGDLYQTWVDAYAPDLTATPGLNSWPGRVYSMSLSGDEHRIGMLVVRYYKTFIQFGDLP